MATLDLEPTLEWTNRVDLKTTSGNANSVCGFEATLEKQNLEQTMKLLTKTDCNVSQIIMEVKKKVLTITSY